MLNDAGGFSQVYIASGYTDIRNGIRWLASMNKNNFKRDPFQKNDLFLFVGNVQTESRALYGKAMDFTSLQKN